MTTPTKLFYVAHPVAGDVHANVDRALRWLRWLSHRSFEYGVTYICPWAAAILSGDDDDADPTRREQALAHDVNVVRHCDGMVLVGGRVSSGMAIECDAAKLAERMILDLTHLGEEPPSTPFVELFKDEFQMSSPSLSELLGGSK